MEMRSKQPAGPREGSVFCPKGRPGGGEQRTRRTRRIEPLYFATRGSAGASPSQFATRSLREDPGDLLLHRLGSRPKRRKVLDFRMMERSGVLFPAETDPPQHCTVPFTAETTMERRRAIPVSDFSGMERRCGGSVISETGMPQRCGNPFTAGTDMERRRSKVVSAVNGTVQRCGGSVSAVNDMPQRFIVLKTNSLQRVAVGAVCDRPLSHPHLHGQISPVDTPPP